MPSGAEVVGRLLVGRDPESAQVRAVLDRVTGGEAASLLIFGEAGVGKTALVAEAWRQADPRLLLLSGACLPLQTITVPLLPLRSALRAAQASSHPRFDPWETADQAPRVLDAWLEEVTASRPVALLVDDLQWADQSTLDVLMYLAAGPRDRRVALVVRTHR